MSSHMTAENVQRKKIELIQLIITTYSFRFVNIPITCYQIYDFQKL